MSLANLINRALPQTQCQRCGFPECKAYAESISMGRSDINRCPPGGDIVIRHLANLLDRPEQPLARDVGPPNPPQNAEIDADTCIGCTKCLLACPVDAIAGAKKHLHYVIEAACTGCELCVPACPVNCIRMQPQEEREEDSKKFAAGERGVDKIWERFRKVSQINYERYTEHTERLKMTNKANRKSLDGADNKSMKLRKAEIAAAVSRVHRRRNTSR